MDELLEKAPYIGALVLVVLIFVRDRHSADKRRDEVEGQRWAEAERLSNQCHAHTKELNERTSVAIDNAARIIEANTKIIGAIERRMNGK